MGKEQRYAPELPSDVLTEIFLRVPAESLVRAKRVCKNWYELIGDEDFVRSHLERWRSAARVLVSAVPGLGGRMPKICLLTLKFDDQQVQSYCDEICLDGLVDALPLGMPVHTDDDVWFTLLDSCDGLLLLEVNDWRPAATACNMLLVCNPITKWYMLLPLCPSFHVFNLSWFIASDDPVQRYKIIGIETYPRTKSPNIIRCFIFELRRGEGRGSGFWKELPADKPLFRWIPADKPWSGYLRVLPPSLSVGRKVHWLAGQKPEELVLLSLDLSTERLTATKTRNSPELTGWYCWFLSDGAMCFGRRIEFSNETEVWILEDFDRPMWRKHHVVTNYPPGPGFPSEDCSLSGILYMKEEDELIIRRGEDRFVYKMSTREWRRIVAPCKDPSTSVLTSYRHYRHVNSLVGCGPRNRITC